MQYIAAVEEIASRMQHSRDHVRRESAATGAIAENITILSVQISHAAAAADTSNHRLEAKRDASNATHQLRGQIVMMTMVFEQLDSMRGPAN